jgi:guanyl-specific ribonuclease Sa
MTKKINTIIMIVATVIILLLVLKNNKDLNDIKNIVSTNTQQSVDKSKQNTKNEKNTKTQTIIATSDSSNISSEIKELTKVDVVSKYILENGKLPDYYITKKEAMNLGWIASKGNLCEVAPGKAIGGDYFTNREKILPMTKNRRWYEVDVNYNCGNRGADRILFSNDGLVYVTYDHYKTFQEIK